jgi:2-methylcitrate dehydratase PrpD
VEGVLGLKRRHGFSPEEIEAIRVASFETALHIMSFPPTHSDGAQYSLPWAVAAAAVDGTLGVDQIHPSRFDDPRILALGKKVGVVVAEDLDARFPEECLARVEIRLNDGSTFTTGTMAARGDYTEPLPESEIDEKFRTLVQHARGEAETEELLAVIDTLDQRPASDLVKRLT